MDGVDFSNLLRTANCLDTSDFIKVFGDDHEHYQDKLYITYKRDLAKFIMYLDLGNVNAFFNHLQEKQNNS